MSHRPEVKLGVPPIPAIKRPHLDLTPGPLHSLGSPTAPSVGGGVGNGTQGDAAPAALRRGRPRGSPHGGGRLPHRGARDPPPPRPARTWRRAPGPMRRRPAAQPRPAPPLLGEAAGGETGRDWPAPFCAVLSLDRSGRGGIITFLPAAAAAGRGREKRRLRESSPLFSRCFSPL